MKIILIIKQSFKKNVIIKNSDASNFSNPLRSVMDLKLKSKNMNNFNNEINIYCDNIKETIDKDNINQNFKII